MDKEKDDEKHVLKKVLEVLDKEFEILEKEQELGILEKELEVLMWGFTEEEYARFWKRKEKVKKGVKKDESV